jgi:hypothetical protein
MEQQQQQPPQQPQQPQQQQSQQQAPQQQPQVGGVPGPTGRRLHIAHRRSPSELTPLMSMFANPGMEQLAIQQQIELLQQQQQQIQATHQQYVNMGMVPPGQPIGPGGAFNPLQPMPNMSQAAFQFPNQVPQQNMAPPTQPCHLTPWLISIFVQGRGMKPNTHRDILALSSCGWFDMRFDGPEHDEHLSVFLWELHAPNNYCVLKAIYKAV